MLRYAKSVTFIAGLFQVSGHQQFLLSEGPVSTFPDLQSGSELVISVSSFYMVAVVGFLGFLSAFQC